MPTSAATASAARWLSPVSSTGPQPERAQLRDRLGAGRLDRVGDDDDPAHAAVPADPDGGAARGLGLVRRCSRARRGPAATIVGESTRDAADDHGVAVDDAADAAAPGSANDVELRQQRRPVRARRRRRSRPAMGCSDASSRAPASRSTSSASSPSAAMTSTSVIRPVVTVPVLSSTTVSTRRVDSSTSGPLIRMPSWAPRPVPTSSAVGVASPSAHGQAMISTATAAVNAAVAAPAPSSQPTARVASDSAITTGTNTAETRSARRCTWALPFWASSTSRAICASWVSAPTRVARTTSRPPAFTVAPATVVAGADLDRHRLAGEHRGVDRRRALDDDAVGGDLLARPHDEQVADRELVDRDAHLDAVAQDGDVLGAEVEQRPQRRPGRRLGAGLEVAARPG